MTGTKKRIAGVTAVIIAAAFIGWTIWLVGVDVEPAAESGYYDQFLFAEDAPVTALLAQVVAEAPQVPAPEGESSSASVWYDGALLAPYLPNCAEMGTVEVVKGGVFEIRYTPAEPEDCVQAALLYVDGQVRMVTVTQTGGRTLSADVAEMPEPVPTPTPTRDPAGEVEEAFADLAGWADGGVYAALDPAELFDGELLERAVEADPACENPLYTRRAFVLTDGEGLTPEEAAKRLLEELLAYYSQEQEGCPFRITAYAVAEQELMDRDALRARTERAVLLEDTTRWTSSALWETRQEYPWLPDGMWCLTPAVRVDWRGFLDLKGSFRIWGQLNDPAQTEIAGPVWVLLCDDGRYWLQRSEALTELLQGE